MSANLLQIENIEQRLDAHAVLRGVTLDVASRRGPRRHRPKRRRQEHALALYQSVGAGPRRPDRCFPLSQYASSLEKRLVA
jgi:hypothetical protein